MGKSFGNDIIILWICNDYCDFCSNHIYKVCLCKCFNLFTSTAVIDFIYGGINYTHDITLRD
ncbi:hypothetical protein D3C76_130000 [compost metagenome]